VFDLNELSQRIEYTGKQQTYGLGGNHGRICDHTVHLMLIVETAHCFPLGRIPDTERRIARAGCGGCGHIDHGQSGKMSAQLGKIHDHATANAYDHIKPFLRSPSGQLLRILMITGTVMNLYLKLNIGSFCK
jgi:hypothetical protein